MDNKYSSRQDLRSIRYLAGENQAAVTKLIGKVFSPFFPMEVVAINSSIGMVNPFCLVCRAENISYLVIRIQLEKI